MSINGILENIVASVILAFITIGIGYFWGVISRRARLHKFFGVKESKKLVLYLSNIRVKTNGSIGVSGENFSYRGSTIAYGEMLGANHIKELQSFLIPSIADPHGAIKNLLLVDVKTQILISPLLENKLEKDAPIISLGSPAYNIASRYIENLENNYTKICFGILPENEIDITERENQFIRDTSSSVGVVIDRGAVDSIQDSNNEEKPSSFNGIPSAIKVKDLPKITGGKYGFVQRIFVRKTNQFLFYVAGLSEFATKGAAHFLKSEWDHLFKKFSDDKEFLVLLQFDNLDFTQWTVVFDRELD